MTTHVLPPHLEAAYQRDRRSLWHGRLCQINQGAFCDDMKCLCHQDKEATSRLCGAVMDGTLTMYEMLRLFFGQGI